MAFHQPFQIIGFHSCDRKVGLKVLNGEIPLNPSKNRWDWLGSGIYFWQQNPERALEYAQECAEGRQKNSGRIEVPFIVGAILELGNCLNLVEPKSIVALQHAHDRLAIMVKESGDRMPINKGANRMLDCAVVQFVHESQRSESEEAFDTVRSAFQEGEPIYPGSNFTQRLHIEVCIINADLIKGYFLPRPIAKYNPYHKKEFIGREY